MVKKRSFSLYEIEEYLKEVGAKKVNEKAVVSFETELEKTVKELLNEAQIYANYAGRKKLITPSDIEIALNNRTKTGHSHSLLKKRALSQRRPKNKKKNRVVIIEEK